MSRAGWAAMLAIACALLVGTLVAGDDVDDELAAARTLARLTAALGDTAAVDDTVLLERLRQASQGAPLRHLSFALHDADGRLRMASGPAAALDAGEIVRWSLPRPAGPPWSARWVTVSESERAEARAALAGQIAVLALGACAMLGVMTWNVRRGLAPLQAMLRAVAAMADGDWAAARRVEPPRLRELRDVREALVALGDALERSDREHRLLSRKALSLQDEERSRIARELHDELGQGLTALRLETSVLGRVARQGGDVGTAVGRVDDATARVQQQLSGLLRQLSAPAAPAADAVPRLQELLEDLVEGWNARGGPHPAVTLRCVLDDSSPTDAGLVRTVHRITQEALTNAVRHAQASRVEVTVLQRGERLCWSVEDDGIGIANLAAAQRRGCGLAGMRERIWSVGAELRVGHAGATAPRPGLRLAADLPLTLSATSAGLG
ncbi:MAG: histidine kinase [Rubrivivax sp.]|nr:histidine kinase [Rubrivivax sp.]